VKYIKQELHLNAIPSKIGQKYLQIPPLRSPT
jgi:hypothetical protein